ncbi:hypothetical protein [Rhodoferax sp.]|uniref:hypothetical protein n=1 Tax=Rhodoferax sp. TaxID=50421 RepID=UPI00261A429E|nr:hypothetical protein [Rhodoferax sp.]
MIFFCSAVRLTSTATASFAGTGGSMYLKGARKPPLEINGSNPLGSTLVAPAKPAG